MAVAPPIPSARVKTALAVKTGDSRSWRIAYRISPISCCMANLLRYAALHIKHASRRSSYDREDQSSRQILNSGVLERIFLCPVSQNVVAKLYIPVMVRLPLSLALLR